eukprot:TRINITY_DN7617_c0_g1_i1.p1 TRINITY_DN7617_c0_g1~~TRINITY_DN7617_c0_g1_i1.p1  ORF type:complete len:276 (-),score=21.33 TRINITY_DN7617_c0_g1_i1:61-825(-)
MASLSRSLSLSLSTAPSLFKVLLVALVHASKVRYDESVMPTSTAAECTTALNASTVISVSPGQPPSSTNIMPVVCCPAACTFCGGNECGSGYGDLSWSTADTDDRNTILDNCCHQQIIKKGHLCSSSSSTLPCFENCPSGKWRDTADMNRCKPITDCSATQATYAAVPATLTSDAVCAQCPSGEWLDQSDNKCKMITTCLTKCGVKVQATLTSDATCNLCPCDAKKNGECCKYCSDLAWPTSAELRDGRLVPCC